MPKRLDQNHILLIMLAGGVLLVIIAACVAGFLLSRMSHPEPEMSTNLPTHTAELLPTSPEHEDTPTKVSNTPTSPPPTNTLPSATPAPIPVSGDQLSLPSATPTSTPIPSPTYTPTPSPPPTPTAIPQLVEGVSVGKLAPDFTLGSNLDSRVSLSDLRGKVVVLNFWTTWCPSCRHEVPALQAIHNEYGPQGVVVLAVNLREKLENVERFAHDNGVSFNVWLDEDGWAGNKYGVRSIPITYFIDQDGIIQAVHIGSMSRDQIVNQLEKLL